MFVALTKEEVVKARALRAPLTDLKPGDVVRWKSGVSPTQRTPKATEHAIVWRVYPRTELLHEGPGMPVRFSDFSALYKDPDDGELVEYQHDSAQFERVTD